jgi:alpha-tubulin suppressor-like RCC1 family protein
MAVRSRLLCAALATTLAVVGSGLAAQGAFGASVAKKPVITALTATPPKVNAVGGSTTVVAKVQAATTCKVESLPALLGGAGSFSCAKGSFKDALLFPTNPSAVTYLVIVIAKGPGGSVTATIKVKVRAGAGGGIAGVQSAASDSDGSCALLGANGGVQCWGYDMNGQLGDGQLDTSSPLGSATPVQVEGVGGNGTLTGVASLLGVDGEGYCALLNSSQVDCWGFGQAGGLGDGMFADSAVPVQVQDVAGDGGALSGVAGLASDGLTVCAVLTSGQVDCWGYGPNGELGNGQFYTVSPFGSAAPVGVVDVTDDGGLLSGVSSLTGGQDGFCALLGSGGVDCWGDATSAVPVQVPDVSDDGGILSNVSEIAGDSTGTYCAVLTSTAVDCWGNGEGGELGDGQDSSSASPVNVQAVSGSGALGGVSTLTSDEDGYCALLGSGGVDCWGNGTFGILGNGQFSSSATPVQVGGMSSTAGVLHRATSLTGDGNGFCVVLKGTSGEVACWGEGADGALGSGQYYPGTGGSASPVQVLDVGGIGALTSVAALVGGGDGYCAVLSSSEVVCWGYAPDGELGNGQYYSSPNGSALPVQVL